MVVFGTTQRFLEVGIATVKNVIPCPSDKHVQSCRTAFEQSSAKTEGLASREGQFGSCVLQPADWLGATDATATGASDSGDLTCGCLFGEDMEECIRRAKTVFIHENEQA